MADTLWDAITRKATDFLEGGQERRQWLDNLGRSAEYYVPPELRNLLGFAAEMTPTATLDRAAQAGGEMMAPGRTPMERLGSAGQMLSETAGVAAPMLVANRAAMPAAEALQDAFMGFSVGADDVGRRFVERMNQPGPVPTMYSNPLRVFHGGKDLITRPRATVDPEGLLPGFSVTPDENIAGMYARMRGGDAISSFEIDEKKLNPIGEMELYELQNFLEMSRGFDEGGLPDADLLKELKDRGINAVKYDDPEFGIRVLDTSILKPSANPIPRNDAEAMPKQVFEMRAAGRAGDVPEEMMAAADPRLGQEYEMVGADIAKSLQDVPTALEVMGKESMPHGAGFSAMKAQRNTILPEHYSRGLLSTEMTPPVETDWQSKSGKTILGLVGDPTARKFIQQVGDEELPSSIFSQAGAEFADINDWGWASDLGAMGPKLNAAAGVEDPYFVFLNMGEKSGDFAKHTGRLVGEAVRGARISSNAIPEIDDAIRNIGMSQNIPVMLPDGTQALTAKGNPKFKSVTVRPFSDFKSIADPDYLGNYIESLPSGTLRAGFIKGLDKSGLQKKGFPNIGELRMAMANPDLIGRDWLTAGYRGFTPDIEAGLIETTPDIHETYNTKIKKVGQSETLDQGGRGVPANLLFSDLAAEQRAKGTGGLLVPTSADYKVFEMSPYRAQQVMHDKAVEMVSTFTEIEQRFGRRAALEYANQLTQGGEITGQLIEAARKANAPTWMLAALAPSYGLLSQQDQEVQ